MKKLLLLIGATSVFSLSNAQYDMAIGAIYAKDGIGLSYKQFVQPEQNIVINAMCSQNNYDFGGLLVGLYEFHKRDSLFNIAYHSIKLVFWWRLAHRLLGKQRKLCYYCF